MTAPTIYPYPLKRAAGFLRNARFDGDNDALRFQVDYPDSGGQIQTIEFRLFEDGIDYQEMCIPTAAYDINKIHPDALIAHMRMASIISDTIPTSQEWKDVLMVEGDGNAKFFQTAVGQTRVVNTGVLSGDQTIAVEFRRGATTNRKTVEVGYPEIAKDYYQYAPSTQLMIIPGSVLKQFPTGYKHDFPNGDILTAQERADIIAYVNALEPWV